MLCLTWVNMRQQRAAQDKSHLEVADNSIHPFNWRILQINVVQQWFSSFTGVFVCLFFHRQFTLSAQYLRRLKENIFYYIFYIKQMWFSTLDLSFRSVFIN